MSVCPRMLRLVVPLCAAVVFSGLAAAQQPQLAGALQHAERQVVHQADRRDERAEADEHREHGLDGVQQLLNHMIEEDADRRAQENAGYIRGGDGDGWQATRQV